MTHLLHLDASARPGRAGIDLHGAHTRRLSRHFVDRWRALRPHDRVHYRDIGARPPQPVSSDWIAATFTPEAARDPAARAALAESDALIDELLAADVLVLGVPMYNFYAPAGFKAWIDNVVRVGRTFGFDAARGDDATFPLLDDRPRRAVLLSSRGGFGMDEGGPYAHMNHLDPGVKTALGFIGIRDVRSVAVEYQEYGDARLEASFRDALAQVEALVDELQRTR